MEKFKKCTTNGARNTIYRKNRKAHLANVDVGALRVDLRVVEVQHGGVDTSSRRDVVATLVGGDDVGGGAVLALPAETDGRVGQQVVAAGVDETIVHDGKLVSVV